MAHRSDLIPGSAPGVTDEHRSRAAEALALAAVHLVTVDPEDVLADGIDFAVLVGAKVYEVGGRSGSGGGVRISRLALEAVGEVPEGITRAAFAGPVAAAAQSLGYDWTGDDNRRVIPEIPAPRREQRTEGGR